jgi:hypothetical protein
LSRKDRDEAADLPLPQPQIMPPPGGQVQDRARVSDGQGPDPVGDRPVDHRLRRLVLGLPDPALVAAFDGPATAAGLTPPP